MKTLLKIVLGISILYLILGPGLLDLGGTFRATADMTLPYRLSSYENDLGDSYYTVDRKVIYMADVSWKELEKFEEQQRAEQYLDSLLTAYHQKEAGKFQRKEY